MGYTNFNELAAVARLQELAETPLDLTSPEVLSAQRFADCKASSCGFDYLFTTQRVDEKTLAALQSLADEAALVEQMRAMQSGAVMNKINGFASENRQVLHTASRDIFSDSALEPEAASKAQEQLDRLRNFLTALEDGSVCNPQGKPFTTMVQIGIGGSDLGPRALYLALKKYSLPGRKACFIANVDPDDAAEVLAGLDLSKTLVNVVSKSGTTLETLTNETLVREKFLKAGLDPTKHFIAVTGKDSPMDDPKKYLATFHMFDYIGGRYSATSMVGGVTLGFAIGHNRFQELLQGAHDMDRCALQTDLRKNLPLLTALIGIWNHNFLGYPTVAILPYSQPLSRFPAHLQQCDMESNGKSVTRNGEPVFWQTGPIVWGEPGTNGQHAFYQLLHQGTEIVPCEFIGFRKSQHNCDLTVKGTDSQQKLLANMLAQSLALAQGRDHENPNRRFSGNRPSSILLAERLDPYAMGALLALYENRIAFQGFCWNINSFDQEGVQLGKILATKLLQELSKNGEDTLENPENFSVEKEMLSAASLI